MRPSRSFLLIVLLGAAVILHRPLRHLALTVLRFPLTVVEHVFDTLVWLPRLASLVHENTSLRSELAADRLELVSLREVVRHLNQAARLESLNTSESSLVASVIGRTVVPTQHVLILNKGKRHGVVLDGVLLDADGLLGRVLEVHPVTSLAMLITDPESRVAAMVERSREAGLLVGTGGSLCRLIYLDVAADVVEQDRIITAGLNGPFPKGVAVGTVVKVIRDEDQAFAFAWIRPAVKLSRVEEVVCVKPARSAE